MLLLELRCLIIKIYDSNIDDICVAKFIIEIEYIQFNYSYKLQAIAHGYARCISVIAVNSLCPFSKIKRSP